MSDTVIMQWAFNSRGKIAWRSPDNRSDIVQLPASGVFNLDEVVRIDSFVAAGTYNPTEPDHVCTAKIVRSDKGRIQFKLDPPDAPYAYRSWVNGEATIVGDVGLWLETFVMDSETA